MQCIPPLLCFSAPQALVSRMQNAFSEDREDCKRGAPGVKKLRMLEEVKTTVEKCLPILLRRGEERNRGGGGERLALIFIPARGGYPSPLDPSPPPLDPLAPSPLSSSAPENLGFGNIF